MDDDQPSFTRIIEPAAAGSAPRAVPAGLHPALVWRPKLGEEQTFPLEHRSATIGRHEDNDIVLAGPTVSARHATVRVAFLPRRPEQRQVPLVERAHRRDEADPAGRRGYTQLRDRARDSHCAVASARTS